MTVPYGYILLGALEWGVVVSNLLFGIVTMQTFDYYQKFPQDRWQLKTLVGVLWLLELGHTICIVDGIYVETITERGQVKTINIAMGFRVAYYFSFMTNALVQAFYAYRLKQLFDKAYLAILCWFLTTSRFLSAVIAESLDGKWKDVEPRRWGIMILVGLLLEATVDLIITCSMWYFLAKRRRRSIQRSTIRLLERLIAITIPTGFLTFVMAMITAIMLVRLREYDPSLIPLIFCQAKLYSNSMLASLNSRSMLRERYWDDAKPARSLISQPPLFNNHLSGSVLVPDVELDIRSGSNPMIKNPNP